MQTSTEDIANNIAPRPREPLSRADLEAKIEQLEARCDRYFAWVLKAENRAARYAEVLSVFGTFWSATMAHDCTREKRPVITRRAPMGFFFGLADKLTLTADDFRMAGHVLHEHKPAPAGDVDVDEMAQKISAQSRAYLKRHPEQVAPWVAKKLAERTES